MTRDLDRTRTHTPAPDDDPALDAGLAAAFAPESTPGGWSQPPILRDDSSDGPLVQPASPEMPRTASDRYQLLGEVARGGMGVILKGRDPRLGRDMAFKVLKTEHVGRQAAEQRFVEEAQVGGQLQHPGILPVYDLGRFDDGRPFFAMKLVKGDTLADQLTERPDPAADRGKFLQMFLKVCETVAYAHSRGVIHRDIKPSNIMVAKYGEVLVMDWGLAKVLPRGGVADEARATQVSRERDQPEKYEPTVIHTARVGSIGSETVAGSVMGTPAFMPPEQAGGEIDKLDERADVFGLGAVLCVILTGKPPYVAADAEAVRLMAVRGKLDGAHSRLDASGSDAELIGLCKWCLSAEPADRPRHAGEVKEAVAEYLAGVEDRAHRAQIERAAADVRTAEQTKRRRVQAAAGLAFTALLVVGGSAGWWADRQASERRREHEVAAAREREALTAALDQAEAALRAEKMPEADAALAVAEQRLVDADAKDLRERFESVRKDRDMVRELEDIAEQRWVFAGEETTEKALEVRARRRYAEAFRRYGLALGDATPESTVAAVAQLRISGAMVSGLTEWFFIDPKAPGLATVLSQLDTDPLRTEVRGAVAAGQEDRIRESTRKLNAAALTPEFAGALGMHSALSAEEGYKLMRAAWDAHPQSFPLAMRIAYQLRGGRSKQSTDRTKLAETAAWNRTAVALRPSNAVAYASLAYTLRLLKDWDGALAACKRSLEIAPRYSWAIGEMTQLLNHTKDLDTALALAKRGVENAPNEAHSWHTLGHVHEHRKDYPAAVAAFRKAVAQKDSEAHDFGCLGKALILAMDAPAAEAAYRKMLELDPRSANAHNGLGAALNSKGEHDGAIAALQEAIQLDPNLPQAYYGLANALLSKGKVDSAIEAARKAVGLDPNWDGAHFMLGQALLKKGEVDDAIAAYWEAIRLEPEQGEYRSFLGDALLRKEDVDGAIAAYREAIHLDPKTAFHHYYLGFALGKKRDLVGAIAEFREAIRLDSRYSSIQTGLGQDLINKGDFAGAIAEYREVLRLDPKFVPILNDLAWLLATGPDGVRDGKEAVRLATQACELTDWKIAGFLDTLAASYAEARDFDKAVEYMKKALALPSLGKELERGLKERLAVFERKQPYRDPVFAPRELGQPPREVKP